MNQHLSSERISAWMIGEQIAQEEAHARVCELCRAEIDRLTSSLQQFRGAVWGWAGRQEDAAPKHYLEVVSRQRVTHAWRVWTAIAAMVVIVAAIPVYRSHENAQRAAAMAREDAALLQLVDTELSRPVPEPLEPLMKLTAPRPKGNHE